MHRALTLAGGSVVAGAVVFGAARVPPVLAELELFRVRSIELEGARFLEVDDVTRHLALDPEASVWDELGPWEERVREHPLVQTVDIRRRFPGSLVLSVTERQPVALFPFTAMEPVDEEGVIMPLDEHLHSLDLPVLHPEVRGRPGELLTPAQLRILAQETGRLARLDPGFMARVSQLQLGEEDEVWIHLADMPVRFRFRIPLDPHRLTEAKEALEDAMARFPDREVRELDLSFDEQVVVRFSKSGRG
jgi:hypothetical protein